MLLSLTRVRYSFITKQLWLVLKLAGILCVGIKISKIRTINWNTSFYTSKQQCTWINTSNMRTGSNSRCFSIEVKLTTVQPIELQSLIFDHNRLAFEMTQWFGQTFCDCKHRRPRQTSNPANWRNRQILILYTKDENNLESMKTPYCQFRAQNG